MKKLEDESSHLTMGLMDVPRYILELRDEIKALRAEVKALKPKCESYNGPTDKLDNDADLPSYIINRPKI